MKHYLKLVNFEFNRFFKLYLVLIGITILSQIIGVIVTARMHVNRANEWIYNEHMSEGDIQLGKISFYDFSQSAWFTGPIALGIATLLIYVFFIWYRDWFGKNTFSYRLFMLPIARIQIYLAKAATILLYVLGLIALQLLLLPVEAQILKWMVPSEFRTDLSSNEITYLPNLALLIPNTFGEFILYYAAGIGAVSIVFTAILFERSYRVKGIIYGILFCAASQFIFFAPLLVNTFILKNYFYPTELFFMELAVGLVVVACSIWTANSLIKNKVRV